MTDRLRALVRVELIVEADVEVEPEGIKARIANPPWRNSSIILSTVDKENVTMTEKAVEYTKQLLIYSAVQLAAQSTKAPEGIESVNTPKSVLGKEVN